MRDILAGTSTASPFALIGPAKGYTGVRAYAESVGQNCVLGTCAILGFNRSATITTVYVQNIVCTVQ